MGFKSGDLGGTCIVNNSAHIALRAWRAFAQFKTGQLSLMNSFELRFSLFLNISRKFLRMKSTNFWYCSQIKGDLWSNSWNNEQLAIVKISLVY